MKQEVLSIDEMLAKAVQDCLDIQLVLPAYFEQLGPGSLDDTFKPSDKLIKKMQAHALFPVATGAPVVHALGDQLGYQDATQTTGILGEKAAELRGGIHTLIEAETECKGSWDGYRTYYDRNVIGLRTEYNLQPQSER